jgi:hypothetical protein
MDVKNKENIYKINNIISIPGFDDASGLFHGTCKFKEGNNIINKNVLFLENLPGEKEVSLSKDEIIVLPENIETSLLHLILTLAFALFNLQKMKLELGETVLISGDSYTAKIFAKTALFNGALKVIQLGNNSIKSENVNFIPFLKEDPDKSIKEVLDLMENSKGFIAVDLSGDPNIIDIILEIIPVWGRLLFAHAHTKNITVDYYNNLHRKGILTYSTINNTEKVFNELKRQRNQQFILNACRILDNKRMISELLTQ